MNPKGQGVIRGRPDLFYDLKRSRGHKEVAMTYFMTLKVTVTVVVRLTYFMTPKCQGVIRGQRDLLMTSKVTVTFVVGLTYFMTTKGHGVIRGRRDLLYDPQGHGDLCGWFDLVYDLKSSRGH